MGLLCGDKHFKTDQGRLSTSMRAETWGPARLTEVVQIWLLTVRAESFEAAFGEGYWSSKRAASEGSCSTSFDQDSCSAKRTSC